MSVNAAFLSSLSAWHALEQRMDRWASVGAFAFALATVAVVLLVR